MRKRLLGFGVLFTLFLAFSSVLVISGQQTRRKPAAEPVARDLKIKYRSTTSGRSYENTTMIKGVRERTETQMGQGIDLVGITQCDLKRSIQINNTVRKYVVTPMTTSTTSSTGPAASSTPIQPTRRGGVITYVITAVDTGERKEMFGFTARHVKSSMTMTSSPDACSQVNQKIDTDGWYIDLSFGFECDLGRSQMVGPPAVAGGCQDRAEIKNVGTARKGYPLIETTTMYGPDGRVLYATTKEVVELSRDPLDAALFEIPAGYTEAASVQELYVTSSTENTGGQTTATVPEQTTTPTASPYAKAPGTIRVGVVQINNRTDREVSTEGVRQRLIGEIRGANVDAIAINAFSPADVEAEARTKQCDFVLYTDIATMKSSKLGGMFGRVTGASTAGKTESKLEFKLIAVGETSPRLQSTATAKEDGDEASVGTAVAQEARMVSTAVRGSGGN
jgi:hypothetical protein